MAEVAVVKWQGSCLRGRGATWSVTLTILVMTMSATQSKTGVAPPLVHVELIIEKTISRDDAGKSVFFVDDGDGILAGLVVCALAGSRSSSS